VIPVISFAGVGTRGTQGTYRLLSIGGGESAIFQVSTLPLPSGTEQASPLPTSS